MSKTAVVILNWNGKDFLEKFLPPLVQRTPEELGSIIVADNGSTDGSLALLEEQYPTIRTIRLDKNYGFTGGYNRAFEAIASAPQSYGTFDYYLLLNSDVEVADGWLEALSTFMDSHPEAGICSPKVLSYDRPEYFEHAGACGGMIDRFYFPYCRGRILSKVERDQGQYDTPAEVFWASGTSFMIRAELWHRLGGLDESFFAHMEEIDLCWRAKLSGEQVWVVPSARIYHVGGGTLPNNSPRKLYLNFRNNLLMMEKNLPDSSRRRIIFTRMCIDGAAAIAYLLMGKVEYFRSVIRAHRDFKRMRRNIVCTPQTVAVPRPKGSVFLMNRGLRTVLRGIKVFFALLVTILCIFSISPIYRWEEPRPFSGDKIYNPYSGSDSTTVWKRATFHTHTKVDKGINECPYYPDVVYDDYMALGYEIVAFTNHNALTRHPYDDRLDLYGYEHGYNLFKLHNNIFGASKVQRYDILLPLFDSQKQFKMNLAAKRGDFMVLNHPDRTLGISARTMERLSGYRLIEGDSGFQERDGGEGTHLKHWDEALSAGRYAHNVLSDDNHDSKNPARIARRSTWINTPSAEYPDVKGALLRGNFYSMRTPQGIPTDSLPRISNIALEGDTIVFALTAPARRIEIISQGGEVKGTLSDCAQGQYIMQPDEPYIRLAAHYPDGTVIYTNAFARYSEGDSPYAPLSPAVNWPLTILFNLGLLLNILLLGALCSKKALPRKRDKALYRFQTKRSVTLQGHS